MSYARRHSTNVCPGNRVRYMIDYYEHSGEGIPHYVGVLKEKHYIYGEHWAPHDIQVRELGTGKSRLETAATTGSGSGSSVTSVWLTALTPHGYCCRAAGSMRRSAGWV